MQYDVFICHASEDKATFVRPLAEALRLQHVEVWYDEFTLRIGASIRQSIDRGLRQSRFGIVVLSIAFFEKQWPQYELDGLNEREIAGREAVILPIWHDVTHGDVIRYSPSLAGRRAITSAKLSDIVRELISVIRPAGSPLIIARDIVADWEASPPVVTDSRWLEVVEASSRVDAFGATVPAESSWSFWSFPLPPRSSNPQQWGERLAWSYLQLEWTEVAAREHINLLTPPDKVHDFIDAHPGLFETASLFHELLIDYAPQLTIPGFEGRFADLFEGEYRKACDQYDGGGRYSCPPKWALRHPTFGRHKPETVAHAYFDSDMFGPSVSPYEAADHIVWLLSDTSAWLPPLIHAMLLKGVARRRTLWFTRPSDGDDWPGFGTLSDAVYDSVEQGTAFRWNANRQSDLIGYITKACRTLNLAERPEELVARFISNRIVPQQIAANRKRKAHRHRPTPAST